MAWPDTLAPARMERIAVVSPVSRVRSVLVAVAAEGTMEPERLDNTPPGPAGVALQRIQRGTRAGALKPVLIVEPADVTSLVGRGDLNGLAGEAELERVRESMVEEGPIAALAGWSPAGAVDDLAARLAPLGAGVVRLRRPPGIQPPTSLPGHGATGAFQPLVNTYGTVPYADVNPSVLAGLAYVVMFGMMFGDVGQGLLLLGLGIAVWWARPVKASWLSRFHWTAPFVIGAALASIAFGFAYGEAFGPTGLVPTLWLRPLDNATTLLAVSIGVGFALLACSYVLGSVNRFREGGPVRSLVALSGLAGGSLYLGLALVGAGWYEHSSSLALAGVALALAGLALGFVGLFVEAGGRAGGALQAGIELFDSVIRLGTNTVSFARLAAFGLTHAALSALVWEGSVDLWRVGGVLGVVTAIVVFLGGNAITFALEALVAGVQALRLEYYEIFSRVFTREGREFRPWQLAVRQ
jgi:V/A-type H+/Na+-transporting ATPase subunit I